jgi:hypothetical protein
VVPQWISRVDPIFAATAAAELLPLRLHTNILLPPLLACSLSPVKSEEQQMNEETLAQKTEEPRRGGRRADGELLTGAREEV